MYLTKNTITDSTNAERDQKDVCVVFLTGFTELMVSRCQAKESLVVERDGH